MARTSKLPKKKRAVQKLIISLDKKHMLLSNGISSYKVAASGRWPTPAVIHYSMLDIVASLVESENDENPVRLEALENHVQIGPAKIPCSFQNPEINIRGIERAESEEQRSDTNNQPDLDRKAGGGLANLIFLGELKELYPSLTLLPSERLKLVVIPEIPNLLIYVKVKFVEFRVVQDGPVDLDSWKECSQPWKKCTFPQVNELGLEQLIHYAAAVANRKSY